MNLLFIVAASLASAQTTIKPNTVPGNGCPVFDANGNLYVFGAAFGDFELGGSASAWTLPLPPASNATLSYLPNRPPFTASNLVCLSAIYLNSALFLNADPNDPATLHKFNFATQSWRKITMTGPIPNPNSVKAVIDHDTLVIYAFADGHMWRLGDANTNNIDADTNPNVPFSLQWIDASNNQIPFDTTQYQNPTMSQNWISIYFYDAPGLKPGEVWGFRIHYGEWGSVPQPCGSTFPNLHGETATFTFRNASENEHDGAPSHAAYIPDDYSGLWIIDSYINMTISASKPPKDSTSQLTRYAANDRYLIQFTPDTGKLRFLDLSWLFNGQSVDPTAVWTDATVVSNLPRLIGNSSISSASNAGTSGAANNTAGTADTPGSAGNGATATKAASSRIGFNSIASAIMAILSILLI